MHFGIHQFEKFTIGCPKLMIWPLKKNYFENLSNSIKLKKTMQKTKYANLKIYFLLEKQIITNKYNDYLQPIFSLIN